MKCGSAISEQLIHLSPGIRCSQKIQKTCHMLVLERRYRDFASWYVERGLGREQGVGKWLMCSGKDNVT